MEKKLTIEQIKEINRFKSDFKKAMKLQECFHHQKGDCKGKIKKSHSIQKNGRLSIIEGVVNGNSVLYTFTSSIPWGHGPSGSLIPIGKKEASTFFGFCDHHDTVLFSPIENNPFDDSDKHCFLHSYRSFAHSYHRKRQELQSVNDKSTNYYKAVEKLQGSTYLKWRREWIQQGIKDSLPRKEQLDFWVENEEYDSLAYLVEVIDGRFPIAVSSQMSPKVTYKGNGMNNHLDPRIPFSHPMITVLPDHDQTIIILAVFPDDEKGILLLDELETLPDLKFQKAITSLIIANCENTFFSPWFWDQLGSKGQRKLLDEFDENTITTKYHHKFFHSELNFFNRRFRVKD